MPGGLSGCSGRNAATELAGMETSSWKSHC
jgi:hypothetical protein